MSSLGIHLPSIKGLFKPDWMDCEKSSLKVKVNRLIGKLHHKPDFITKSFVKNEYTSIKKKEFWETKNSENFQLKKRKKRSLQNKKKLPNLEIKKIQGYRWSNDLNSSIQSRDATILIGTPKAISPKAKRKITNISIENQLSEEKGFISKSPPAKIKKLQTEIYDDLPSSSSSKSFCCGWNVVF
ncbi:unnamed protein product [Blepharisma stoltei]|uniref:Uncharacterized protein n=1 Tax=Blepharisma stoltei TaxID=1481888 RepID=A0AAU9IZW6_9CILI|nr:unnamed protein product [Blepharisma stoltei]